MESQSILRTRFIPLSHLPTIFLLVGYPMYWLELYILRPMQAKTTPLAWIFFFVLGLIIFSRNYTTITSGLHNFHSWFSKESLLTKLLLILMVMGAGVILLCAFYASLLPPHLEQEFDALNYHITLPRQHLLLGSFKHIPWSSADLFFLPIDFGLAPFWLATALPNKLPQFFFLIGLLGVCNRIARRFSGGKIWPSILLLAAVMGSHAIGIQAGTAMLDIVICYLFLSALDSFLSQKVWLAAIELSFYVWSKPLILVQILATLLIFALIWLLLWICGIRKNIWLTLNGNIKKLATLFILFSIFIAGPFIFKSLRFSGTPIFPVGVGVFRALSVTQPPERWAELKLSEQRLLATREQYGSGRNLLEFARHFWFAAVPEKDVNNRFDYPLGLIYLLFLGPFLFYFFSCLHKKTTFLLSLWVISSWIVWWLGSQQTRYLYVPLILMYLSVALSIRKPSCILLGAMLCAILLTSASVYRAHKQDWGRWGESVLRQKDKELVMMGKTQPHALKALPFYDVAYATFPVEVVDNESAFVLKQK